MKLVIVGAIFNPENEILLCRKSSLDYYIFPGGKSEPGEKELQTLHREIKEELGCNVKYSAFMHSFVDKTIAGDDLYVRMYYTILDREPKPCSEIVELQWYNPSKVVDYPFTPMTTQVLAYLYRA